MKVSRYWMAMMAAVLMTVFLIGCGGGSETVGTMVPTSGANIPGERSRMTSKTMSFSALQQAKEGTRFYAVADRGNPDTMYPVSFNEAQKDGLDSLGIFRTHLMVGAGDSGTPVVNEQGEVVGALAFGFTGNDGLFMTSSIDDMIWTADNDYSRAPNTRAAMAQRNPLVGFYATGVNKNRFEKLQQRNPLLNKFNILDPASTRTAKQAAGRAVAPSAIQAGDSIAIMAVEGPVINLYAVGTATYLYKGKVLCFGHPMDWAGPNQNWPVRRAHFASMVQSPLGTFKLAFPTGPTVGTMTKDGRHAVVVDTAVQPNPIVVESTIVMPNGKTAEGGMHKVARQAGYAAYFTPLVPIESSSAVMDTYDLEGNVTAKVAVIMEDGSTINRMAEVTGSKAVLSDLLFQMMPFFDPNASGFPPSGEGSGDFPMPEPGVDPLKIKSVKFVLTFSKMETFPVPTP